MWIGVADRASGAAITYAQFSHAYQNHGGGWYWVLVGADAWVSVRATGYQEASAWTDAYDSLRALLAEQPSGGGGKK